MRRFVVCLRDGADRSEMPEKQGESGRIGPDLGRQCRGFDSVHDDDRVAGCMLTQLAEIAGAMVIGSSDRTAT